ncbi:MAG: transglutaminase domain-containing protein, partial [Bacteroidales bacterium]|nr:transglutaminase domain-containing protein [Bacteroidales bacterium]
MFFKIFVLTALLTLTGCARRDFFPDTAYGRKVTEDLNSRRSIIGPRWDELSATLDNVNDSRISAALSFLYAYMPLNDLADLPVSYFAGNAEMSVATIDEMPWGKSIPVQIFLNFVLPPRVNNENLDSFRIMYYDEIKNRISGLGIKDAALEINRWCHEKVSYQPSDIRTSSPLSTMLSARGRCGEESTFTVAALRTAGIPARQVYTPRWAHSDDNHAWVEVWIDSQWYYMGACEPEPVLDRGWFTEPARRAMLIHTKAFGLYEGDENVIRREVRYSEINNLKKYAITKEIVVEVCDSSGVPIPEIEVEFQLYNYAEFYPLAKVKTELNGLCSFETGLGDLLVWSGYENIFGYRFISVAEVDTVKIVMNHKPGNLSLIEKDLFAPVAPQPGPGISPELIELNRKLIARGDSIRRAYI